MSSPESYDFCRGRDVNRIYTPRASAVPASAKRGTSLISTYQEGETVKRHYNQDNGPNRALRPVAITADFPARIPCK